MFFYLRIESQGQETEDVEMKDVEVAIQPEVFEQQKPVEQPAPVPQPVKTTASATRDKKMLSLDERMKEFRDMMLERSVGLSLNYLKTYPSSK